MKHAVYRQLFSNNFFLTTLTASSTLPKVFLGKAIFNDSVKNFHFLQLCLVYTYVIQDEQISVIS